jgi:subtilisin-like proprotein convertase family protein
MAVRESDVVGVTFLVGPGCGVTYTEHVEVVVSVAHPRRGALEAVVVSPLGTSTRLLAPRPEDVSQGGFSGWPLMSVETWGERPAGLWRLYIVDRGAGARVWSVGDCSLLLHGHGGDKPADGN